MSYNWLSLLFSLIFLALGNLTSTSSLKLISPLRVTRCITVLASAPSTSCTVQCPTPPAPSLHVQNMYVRTCRKIFSVHVRIVTYGYVTLARLNIRRLITTFCIVMVRGWVSYCETLRMDVCSGVSRILDRGCCSIGACEARAKILRPRPFNWPHPLICNLWPHYSLSSRVASTGA